MERFRITLDGQSLVMGVPEPGVLTLAITNCANSDGCRMNPGGLRGSEYVTWPGCDLEPGDRIEIEVLPEGPSEDPVSSEKIADTLQKHKEAHETRDPQEREREDVRRAAAVLGWTVIEDGSPSPPSSHPLIEKAAGLSTPKPEAETMWRFRVEVRGQNHVIGLPDTGILSVILHAVVRKLADGGREHECELSLGGLRSDGGHVDWAKYQLGIGDLVVVEILPKGPFDEPTRVRTEAQIAAALYDKQRDEVRERARALGWTLIEGDTPEVS